MTVRGVSVKTSPNIALIKYWGKQDVDRNIPLNASLSVTLDSLDLCTTTKIRPSESGDHELTVNQRRYGSNDFPERISRIISFYETRANETLRGQVFCIDSNNNFPMASGLASSASAMSSIALGLAAFYNENDRDVIDAAARLGSGSACRSMYGGFVEWLSDEPSLPKQVYPKSHWPDLAILILVFDQTAKTVSSTVGMQRSIETSDLIKARTSESVSSRIDLTKSYIEERNFNKLADLIMKDSNQLLLKRHRYFLN